MTEIERKINFLIKAVKERGHEIAALKDHMNARATPIVKACDKG